MSAKTFGFKNQQNVGDKGESDFKESYKSLSPIKSEERAIDFHLNTGESVEVKTDTYPMEKTANFFMETVSNSESGKLGGPFRARQDGVKFFVYYYLNNKQFFWFDTIKLCEKLEQLIAEKKYKIKSIKNKTWLTLGYAVPRADLESVLLKHDVFS